jgi:PAS domain S-box-containing protein
VANTEIIDRREGGAPRRKDDALLRALYDNASDAILIVADDGRYADANPAACALLGYSHAELLQLSVWDLTPASHRPQAEARWRQFDAAGQQSGEYSLQRKGGTMVEVEYRAVADFIPGLHLSILCDITRRKEAETALQSSEAQYRAVIESSQDGFWVVDWEGRLLETNGAYARLSGYSRDELRAIRVADLEANESPSEIAAHMEKVVREGSDLFRTWHRAKSGRLWYAEVNVVYQPIGGQFIAFIRDIHRRQRPEELLKARLRLSDIAREGGLDDLLQASLDTVEDFTGSQIGFFHFVDPDQEHLTFQAWSTRTLGSFCETDGKGLHYPISRAGVWVECFHRRAPVIRNDCASLSGRNGLPRGHVPMVRELVVPLLNGDSVLAIIGVGNKPEDYTDDDVAAVQELASMTMDLVERKRVEQTLRHYGRIVAATPDSVALLDLHYVYLAVNDEYLRRTGRPHGMIVGRTVSDIMGEEIFRTRLKDKLDRCLAGELVQYRDWFDILNQGCRLLDVTYAPYRDESGIVAGVVVNTRDVTDLKRAEEALQLTQERLALAVDGAELGLYDANLQTGQVEVNEHYLRMLGFAPNKIAVSVQSWLDSIHPDDRPRVVEILEKWMKAQSVQFEAEYRVRHRSGNWIWILDRGKGFDRDETGRPRRAVGTVADITERKQVEKWLRESEQHMRLAMGAALMGTWEWDIESGEIFWSDNLWAMFGLESEGRPMTLDRFRDLVHPADRDRLEQAVEDSVQRGAHYRLEVRFTRPDGSFRWALTHGRVLGNAADGTRRMVGVDVDITERKQIEERLRESEQRFRTLVNLLPYGVQENDKEGRITFANPALERLHGPQEGGVVGRFIWDFVADDADRERLRDHLKFLVHEQPPPATYFSKDRRADGSVIDVQVDWSYDRDQQGRVQGFIAVITDITERKRAEQRLRLNQFSTEESALAIYWLDVEDRFLYANAQACRSLGYSLAELRTMHAWDIDPEFPEARSEPFWREIRRTKVARFESVHRRKDGSTFPVELSVKYAEYQGKEYNFAFALDITERKRAQARLAESAERLQQLSRRLLSVQEEERRALARELHDDFGQQLAALKLNLAMLERDLRDPMHRSRLARLHPNRRVRPRAYPEHRPSTAPIDAGRPGIGRGAALVRPEPGRTNRLRDRGARSAPGAVVRRNWRRRCFASCRKRSTTPSGTATHAGSTSLVAVDCGELSLMIQDDGAGFDRTPSHRTNRVWD